MSYAHTMKYLDDYNSPHPLYDRLRDLVNAPVQGRASLYKRKTQTVDNKLSTPPSEVIAGYCDARHAGFVEPGTEGLWGADATYHLPRDVTRALHLAAEFLTGTEIDSQFAAPSSHPRRACGVMACIVGYRYIRGVAGVADALTQSGIKPQRVQTFADGRAEFLAALLRKLDAAHEVNDRGDNPNAVLAALQMLIEEMRRVCEWLEMAGQEGNADSIRRDLARTERLLARGVGKRGRRDEEELMP